MTASKQCSRQDCCEPSRVRGMCRKHYDAWIRTLPAPLGNDGSNDDLKAAMPATKAELAAECEMLYCSVSKAILRMRSREEIHVSGWLPPEPGRGHRWTAIFSDGKGEDVKLPQWKKRRHKRAMCAARDAAKAHRPLVDPLIAALFSIAP